MVENCKRNLFVRTLAGRNRHLPNINDSSSDSRGRAERQAINTVCQVWYGKNVLVGEDVGRCSRLCWVGDGRADHEGMPNKVRQRCIGPGTFVEGYDRGYTEGVVVLMSKVECGKSLQG